MMLTQTTRRLREDSGQCPAAAQVRVPGKVCPTASRAAQRLGHAPSLQFCDPAAVSSQTLADPSIERFRLRTWARIDVPRQPAAVSSGNLAVPSSHLGDGRRSSTAESLTFETLKLSAVAVNPEALQTFSTTDSEAELLRGRDASSSEESKPAEE